MVSHAVTRSQSGERPRSQRPFRREDLVPYARPDAGRALVGIVTSLVPYLALSVLMYLALSVSYVLVLAIAIPAAGFLLRTFMMFHDCAHGSLFGAKRANAWVGRVLGLLLFTPFASWRHSHAVHHGTAGDLDRRGVGDLPTLTVSEYERRSSWGRLGYFLFRHPLVMFGLGPVHAIFIQPRLVSRSARPRIRHSVIGTNVALVVLIGGLCWLVGWQSYVMLQTPTALLAGAAGVFLFYVQHQFEGTYWRSAGEWSYAEAALRGSSHLQLPRLLRFFTASIGLHHVHHLNARIPNYNLQRAHDENPIFHGVPKITLWGGVGATRLKLWDEDQRRLVTFAEARAQRRRRRGEAQPSFSNTSR